LLKQSLEIEVVVELTRRKRRLPAKPGELTFRVTSRGLLNPANAFVTRDFPGKKRADFVKTNRLRRRRADFAGLANFLHNAFREHRVHPPVNPCVKLRTLSRQDDPVEVFSRRRTPLGAKARKRPSCEETNFKGPDKAPSIPRIDLLRTNGIQSGKTRTKLRERDTFEIFPKRGIRRWNRCKAARQRPDVKARPANHECILAPGVNVSDASPRAGQVLRDVE